MEKEATEKSTLRNKSIGTKVSEEEYAALEKLAEARGLTLGEWFRELVLAELIAHPAEQVILAEVLAFAGGWRGPRLAVFETWVLAVSSPFPAGRILVRTMRFFYAIRSQSVFWISITFHRFWCHPVLFK